MAKVRRLSVRCEHCHEWFSSPIAFSEDEHFDTATLEGNKIECPHCRKMTGLNKENMRVR